MCVCVCVCVVYSSAVPVMKCRQGRLDVGGVILVVGVWALLADVALLRCWGRREGGRGGRRRLQKQTNQEKQLLLILASELVDWFVSSGEVESRLKGVELGQLLVDTDYIHHVVDEHYFEDAYLFFRFRLDGKWEGPSECVYRTIACH